MAWLRPFKSSKLRLKLALVQQYMFHNTIYVLFLGKHGQVSVLVFLIVPFVHGSTPVGESVAYKPLKIVPKGC